MRVRIYLLAMLGILSVWNAALACPTCKEGLAENGAAGANLARGFELSIYLMLAVPMLILAGLAFLFSMKIQHAHKSGAVPSFEELVAAAEQRSATIPPSI